MMREDNNPAIFDSAGQALAFAYRHAQGNYPSNQLGPRKVDATPPRLPKGQDAAMLAGWVRQAVEAGHKLPHPYDKILLARFATDRMTNLGAKMQVLDDVLELAMGTGLHNRRMVDLLVQRYFGGTVAGEGGKRRPIRQWHIAESCSVSQQTVSAAWCKVRPWLETREKTAMELVERALQGRGLVC